MNRKTFTNTQAYSPIDIQTGETVALEESPTATVAAVVSEKVLAEENNSLEKSKRTNPIKLGIVVNDYQNKFQTFESLENQIGTDIKTVSIFKQFGNNNSKLIQADLEYIKNSEKILMISWEPWNPDQGNDQTIDYLSEITNGNLDNYIEEFAKDIKTYGSNVRIRFAHEFNGNWYPWGNRPDEYKDAFIYIHQKFNDLGVENVDWVWSPNAESVPSQSISYLSNFYPGDEYVDLIGIDGFNFGDTNTNGWKSFDEIFSEPIDYLSKTYEKPLIIAETASAETGGNKAKWIVDMFDVLNSKFINIDEVIWFNLLKEADWRINSTDASLNSFSSQFDL